MRKKFEQKKDPALYLQVYENLKKQIISGIYRFGQKIPSKRVLADHYHISLVTAEHGLRLLIEEGYLESRERSGYVVCYREADLFSEAGPEDRTAVRETPSSSVLPDPPSEDSGIAVSQRPAFPFSVYARTMRKVISDYGEDILRRTPGTGHPALKEALCNYLARSRGIHVSPDRIVVGAGSEYLYGIIVQLLGRDRIYAIEKPSYAKIEQVYLANQARLELLTLGKDGIDTRVLKSTHASVLHITPYRSYPSGVTTTASKKREYLLWAQNGDRYIVEDDYESEFTPSSKPEETVFSLSENDNVLYLNSFSQTIAPALRISYLILPEKLVDVFYSRLGFYACTVPCFEQYTLTEFINSGEFERHLNRVRRFNRLHTETG